MWCHFGTCSWIMLKNVYLVTNLLKETKADVTITANFRSAEELLINEAGIATKF